MASKADCIHELPKRSESQLGQLYKYCKGAAVDCLAEPAVNEADMSVRMRISTDCIDREKMVIRQPGIDTTLYALNPVVLFGHGEEGIVTPVAMSEDEEGNMTVFSQDDGTYAIAFHKSQDKTSSQMFDAVKCGLLRASSVGITPKEVSVRYDDRNKKIPVIDSCYLNEWSYCSVGVNPEAIIKSHRYVPQRERILEAYALQCDAANRILEANKLDGSEILPEIKRSISSLIPKTNVYSRGFQMQKSLTKEQVSKMGAVQLAKSILKMAEYDEETAKMLSDRAEELDESEVEVDASSPDGEAAPEVGEEITKAEGDDEAAAGPEGADVESEPVDDVEPAGQKPGSAAVQAAHSSLSELIANVEASIATLENPGVVKGMEKEVSRLNECLMQMEALHKKEYPDESPIGGGDDVEVTDEVLRSYLARDPRRQGCIVAIGGRLEALSKRVAKGEVKPEQLSKSLAKNARELNRINEMAQNFDGDAELDQMLAGIERKFQDLAAKLDRTPA